MGRPRRPSRASLLATSRPGPAGDRCRGHSAAIGPCMLPRRRRRRAAHERGPVRSGRARPAPRSRPSTGVSARPAILGRLRRRPNLPVRRPQDPLAAGDGTPSSSRAPLSLTSTTYLVWKLTGKHVIDHYTAANSRPLRREPVGLVGRAGRRHRAARAPAQSPLDDQVAGRVSAAAAAETGLAQGTPVIVGTVDAMAEAVSVGVQAPGDMMLMYGSTFFIIQVTDRPVRDSRLWYAPWRGPAPTPRWPDSPPGTLTRWFRDKLARDADSRPSSPRPRPARGAPRASSACPTSRSSGRPFHDAQAKGPSWAWT